MSSFDEKSPKKTRKRDWLDWAQGSVALLTALLAVWINFQQQGLKNQQDNIDLTLKKESTTTVFTDKILQQLNTVSEDSKVIKGVILLELMGLDIQAHLVSRTGDDKKLTKLEEECKQIPSRIALFTANVDALDVSDEAKWVEYAYDTDNRIARHTALVALGRKALQPPGLSWADSLSSNTAVDDSKFAKLLAQRLGEILKLSDNLESPDLAIDALDAISRLAVRYQCISAQLKGSETLVRVLQGMRDLENQLDPKGSVTLHQPTEQSKDESEQQSHDQLTHLDSTWKTLAATRFCDEGDRHPAATVAATR
jgi:hypothetical protein